MPTELANAISTFFNQYGSLLLLGGLIIVFILITVIPQKKQQKKIDEMLSNMKQGDHVRTIGGFFGVIDSIDGDVVILKAGSQKKRIAIARNAIASVNNSDVENMLNETVK